MHATREMIVIETESPFELYIIGRIAGKLKLETVLGSQGNRQLEIDIEAIIEALGK